MSPKQLTMLGASIKKFGDLSGFVFNRRSKNLIGGHQKTKIIPPDSLIKIVDKYEKPTACMTVAEGYVLIDGERFKYREVDADPEWEMEAMIAANKHSGEWDTDLLKLASADFKGMNWEIAGFEIPELKSMGISAPVFPASLTQPLVLPTPPSEPKVQKEETDEEYVKNTPQTEQRIDTQPTNDGSAAFTKVDENTEVKGRRIIIIIDCPSEAVKTDLREKLRVQVTEVGAKFF